MRRHWWILLVALSLAACRELPVDPILAEVEENEELSGGQVTIFDEGPNAFSFAAPGLSNQDALFFFVGNSYFNQNWVQAPASTTARDGLGPFMNARSCAACHFKDGRGFVPDFHSELSEGFLLRLSVPGMGSHGGPVPDPVYGGQLQTASIPALSPQGSFSISYEEQSGTYPDGTPFSLRKPTYTFTDLAYGPLAGDVLFSPRVAPQMIGLGLLEALEESTLLDLADESDADGDGISGRPNYVWNVEEGRTTIGKFGWKANQPSLLQQTSGAFSGDMGITTYIFPDANCVDGTGCDTLPNGGNPEIDDDDLHKVVLYAASLSVPGRRNWTNEVVLQGKYLFNQIGCNGCHIPKLKTGIHPTTPAFSNQTIRPYTDLLLHDMGEGLADGRPDFEATGNEWRTPPLWGIGLFSVVNGHTQYLHDGRARNLEEAILWHGGEAEPSVEQYKHLELSEREAIIEFLNTL